jgi:N-acetylmuramoyl-L-alanine amidase
LGDAGNAVADLQRRLQLVGLTVSPDASGLYGQGTRAAVEAFQHRRRLQVDGVCSPETWATLVEAGFRLGDRFLYHRRPMLRGDDVAQLQQSLSALGFDTGRVDGIFGEMTASALGEFQRNMGLPTDGILGGSTLRALKRVTPWHADHELVATVRDRERLRQAPRTLLGRRIAVGEEGGLDVLVTAVRRRLFTEGAQVVPILHRAGSSQAAAANSARVEAYVGIRLESADRRCVASYYAGYTYESPGGRRLAEILQSMTAAALGVLPQGAHGMSLPVLRETRMPAVVCEFGPARLVVQRNAALASAMVAALAEWVAAPVDDC